MSSSATALPPAEVSNFIYQEAHINQNVGYKLTIVAIIWGVLAFTATVARIWSRRVQKVGLGLDDWLIVAAMTCGVAMIITTCLLPAYGLGRHVAALSKEQDVEIGKTSFAFELVYIPTLSLAKLSILATYRRIFKGVAFWFTVSLWAVFVYIILWTIGILLAVLLECQPISTLWTADCAPPVSVTIATGVLNIVSDVALFVLPQPLIWPLQMNFQRKLGVSLIFCLGFFATFISILRIPLIIKTGTSHVYDITYNLITTDILTIIEPLTIIICACLPITRCLWKSLFSTGMGLSTLRSYLRRRRNSPSEVELGQPGRAWSEISDQKKAASHTGSSEVSEASPSRQTKGQNGSVGDNAINVATQIKVEHYQKPPN